MSVEQDLPRDELALDIRKFAERFYAGNNGKHTGFYQDMSPSTRRILDRNITGGSSLPPIHGPDEVDSLQKDRNALSRAADDEFKQRIDQANESSTLEPEKFFEAMQCLVTVVGKDTTFDEEAPVEPSVPLHDSVRGAQMTFEVRNNSYITDGTIRIDHDSGVREVVFGYAKQSFDKQRGYSRYASYINNRNSDTAVYNSLLTGKTEKADNPGETDLVDVPSEQMLTVLNRIYDVYQQAELAKTQEKQVASEVEMNGQGDVSVLIFGAREGQEVAQVHVPETQEESSISFVGDDGEVTRFEDEQTHEEMELGSDEISL